MSLSRLAAPVSSVQYRSTVFVRCFSVGSCLQKSHHYKVVVAGGGTGGLAVAAKLRKQYGKSLAIVEPSQAHYYQALFTLIGGGMCSLRDSYRRTSSLIPPEVSWVQDRIKSFEPKNNVLNMASGQEITYDFLVISLGHQLNYEKVKGLPEGFHEDPRLASNYSHLYVDHTRPALENVKPGDTAVFTFPDTPVKCGGAPQKIAYIADDLLRRKGIRDKVNIVYNVGVGAIFPSPYYAEVLRGLCKQRGINVNYFTTLREVKTDSSEAVFEKKDGDKLTTESIKYDFLHVSPPQSAPDVIRNNSDLAASSGMVGYLELDKDTLQHVRFPNIFGLGDCSNLPTSKTAAACSSQSAVVVKNIIDLIEHGKSPKHKYDGYTSCPLVTGYSKCIMAEFDYSLGPAETFPIDQRKERRSMFLIKKHMLPVVYWNLMARGKWSGPARYRKLFHFGAL